MDAALVIDNGVGMVKNNRCNTSATPLEAAIVIEPEEVFKANNALVHSIGQQRYDILKEFLGQLDKDDSVCKPIGAEVEKSDGAEKTKTGPCAAPGVMLQAPQLVERVGWNLPEPIWYNVKITSYACKVVDFTDEPNGTFNVPRTKQTEELFLDKVNMGFICILGNPDLIVCAAVKDTYHPNGNIRVIFQIVGDDTEPLVIPGVSNEWVIKIGVLARLRNIGNILEFLNPDGTFHSDSINKLVDNMAADRKDALERLNSNKWTMELMTKHTARDGE